MKRVIIFSLLLACGNFTQNVFAEQNEQTTDQQVTQASFQLGGIWTQELTFAYINGDYAQRLAEIETAYQQKLIAGDLNEAIAIETNSQPSEPTVEMVKFQKKIKKINKEANKELTKIVKKYPNSFVAEVIQNNKTFELSETEIKAWETIQMIRFNNNEDALSLKLKQIQQEAFLKLIVAQTQNYSEATEYSSIKMESDYFILGLDQLRTMLVAAREAGDDIMYECIDEASHAFEKAWAVNHNESYFHDLANDVRQPADKAEKKVAKIYKAKKAQAKKLVRKFFKHPAEEQCEEEVPAQA